MPGLQEEGVECYEAVLRRISVVDNSEPHIGPHLRDWRTQTHRRIWPSLLGVSDLDLDW